MSIPPLVCSTPPPPEQCEDDKDPEDFDVTYNLSQEEDDSAEYNYGNYSSYNIYQNTSQNTVKEKWNADISNISDNNSEEGMKCKEILNDVNLITNNELAKEDIPKYEESAVEDLNLVLDKDIVHSINISSKEFETEVEIEIELDRQARIQHEDGTDDSLRDKSMDITILNELSIPDENDLDDKHEDVQSNVVEITTDSEITHVNSSENDLCDTKNIETEQITLTDQVVSTFTETPTPVCQTDVVQVKDESSPDNADDDFGDFEDFQLTSAPENCQFVSVYSENPWESECIEGPEFGDFTANFDDKETEPVKTVESTTDETPSERKEIKTSISLEGEEDEFGDFDDFRSSDNTEILASAKETSSHDVNLWNLSSSDNDLQVVDSINTMLASIFPEPIPEPESDIVGRLESFLRETWGHMVDIEVRQPYMVNWNNSLGQKTLLKALCIDSRNILFGPKWPKYAVNLTAAPLQPQKPFVPSGTSEPAEKVTTKDVGSWVDPFTPDGQEYTYAEALLLDLEHLMATLDQMANKNSTLKISELLSHACNTENKSVPTEAAIRPTDLDVFESETSTKLSKIYSSTLNVQPLRHINLPDTHIFTPTDSETPRSKTIHYDSGPSGLIPQTVQESTNQPDSLQPQLNETDNKEYWDFQDFKAATISAPTSITQTTEETAVSTSKAAGTYQTQILQPIKLDPIMPTLNWPDPGEVKETFDDFSDFISNTVWNSEIEYSSAITVDRRKDDHTHISTEAEVVATDNVDDEFETFQSAPPVSNSAMDFNINSTFVSQFTSPETLTMKTFENCDIPIKAETKNPKKSNSVNFENHSAVSNNIPKLQEFTFPKQPVAGISNSTDILQPTNASSSGSSRNQHRSDQILQPLSLESYSQINWPNPGIDLQDLSRFNPINSLNSLKSDSSTGGNSKNSSPAHSTANVVPQQTSDDDIWGDFVSSAPKSQHPTPKKTTFADEDEWTDFVSSPSMKPQNGLNTISFNVHTNLSMQKSSIQNNIGPRTNQISLDIPKLNYITPKSSNRGYSEKHFQNL